VIDLEFIERLINVFDESGVDALEIERGGTRVKLSKTPPAVMASPTQGMFPIAAPPPPPSPDANPPEPAGPADAAVPSRDLVEITSPMVGTFYRSPAPDAPPYVEVGSRLSPGDTICIIEAMKLMNELECEVSGTLVEVCAENAQPVEFGQVLFRVDPR
jgi:acetyl-CoA carboxylase biotin carboxyl carrier protein